MMRQNGIMARLQEIAGALSREDQQALLAFAEFLGARAERSNIMIPPPVPKTMPRTDEETVVAAIKRLSAQYPMLDEAKLLDPTSQLMSEYILRGRKAAEVIADLEKLFDAQYQTLSQREHSNP